jgi:hypothetical protein
MNRISILARGTALGAFLLVLPLVAACGDDNTASTPTPGVTATASSLASSATAAPSSSASASASVAATASASSTADSDGTVDTAAGQQTPWTVPSNPNPISGVVTVTKLRMGLHPEDGGWERIVFEFDGTQLPGAVVQYVNQATSCGSGQAVTVNGSDILEVAITNAQAHDNSGTATLTSPAPGPGGSVINQGVSSCDFEGHVTWDFGLNGKHNFKVSTLTNPVRLVIDIKQ